MALEPYLIGQKEETAWRRSTSQSYWPAPHLVYQYAHKSGLLLGSHSLLGCDAV